MRLIEFFKALRGHTNAQNLARETVSFLRSFIQEGVSEQEIKEAAEEHMLKNGADGFWYHNVGALVLVGERTVESVSGKEYTASELRVKADDLVTVDLGPQIGNYWGDLARSFCVQNGRVVPFGEVESIDMHRGFNIVNTLHVEFQRILHKEITFHEVFMRINSFLKRFNYENLDFNKNLGHSIVTQLDERVYIESGNNTKFGEVGFFTFEPHIREKGSQCGFKREDIYYFQGGELKAI